MKKILLVGLMSVLALTVNAEPEGLITLRNTYSDQLAKIGDEEMGSVATAQEQYLAALRALQAQFQQNGQLEPLLKAKQEEARFAESRTVDPTDVSSKVQEIAELQKGYASKIKSLPMGPAQKRLTLAGFYERSLQKLEGELTKKNDISGAIDVKKERDGLADRPEIVSAKAIVGAISQTSSVQQQHKPAAIVDVPKVVPAAAAAQPNKSQIESEVRKRFKAFVDAIEDQDWDDALKYVSPDYVRKNGEQVAGAVLKMKYSMARMVGEDPTAKFRIDSLEVSEEADKVSLTPELWARNKAHSLEKMTWVPVDGEWYLNFNRNEKPGNDRQGGGRRDKRRPSWKR